MRILIATNINGKGLEVDYRLLRELLEEWGHIVVGHQYDIPLPETEVTPFDLGIWLEVINEHLVPAASRWIIFPNPEWTKPEFVRPIQRICEKVLAKTRDGERALKEVFSHVQYVGF